MAAPHEQERKVRRACCYEHGCIVSSLWFNTLHTATDFCIKCGSYFNYQGADHSRVRQWGHWSVFTELYIRAQFKILIYTIVDSVQLIILGGAEIVVTIIASSIPILRALARDRGMRTGQDFALDATPSISWSRRRSSRTRNSRGSLDAPEMAQSEVDRGIQDDNGQDRRTSKRVWYKSRKQVKCLSQIVEVDETQSRNRDSGVDVSPV